MIYRFVQIFSLHLIGKNHPCQNDKIHKDFVISSGAVAVSSILKLILPTTWPETVITFTRHRPAVTACFEEYSR